MRAGRLKRRVTIQSVARVADGYGATTDTWSTVATVWASVQYRGGSESVMSLLTQASGDVAVTVRYRSDVTPGMRMTTDKAGEVLEILSVAPDERRTELLLACRTRVL